MGATMTEREQKSTTCRTCEECGATETLAWRNWKGGFRCNKCYWRIGVSPSASAASSPRLREDRGEMSVMAYMHKSLTSKLALNKRSALTQFAVDGATKPKTWYGKAAGGFFGFLASVITAPFVVGAALYGKARNSMDGVKKQETITFYWIEDDLWCRLPQFHVSENTSWGSIATAKPAKRARFMETKVAIIEGNFDDQNLVILFSKSPDSVDSFQAGRGLATDRVIDTGKPYTNLKETLVWISDNQGRREFLDKSVLQNLQDNRYDALKFTTLPGPPPAQM